MKYTVFFDVYGKKLKTTVDADSIIEAQNVVINKIVFYKVILTNDSQDIDNEEDFKPSDNFDVEDIKNKLGIK